MVKETGRFYARHCAVTNPMDASELRNAFIHSASLVDRIRRFPAERLAMIDAGQSPIGTHKGPKAVIHMIPFQSFDPGFHIDWASVRDRVWLRPLGAIRINNPSYRFNFDGKLSVSQDGKELHGYLQLFTDGILETIDVYGMTPLPGQTISVAFEENLVKFLDQYFKSLEVLGVGLPLAIAYSWIGVHGCRVENHNHCAGPELIDRDDLILPEEVINRVEQDVPASQRRILDTIWRAAGFEYPQRAQP